jgi:hypothetical protein
MLYVFCVVRVRSEFSKHAEAAQNCVPVVQEWNLSTPEYMRYVLVDLAVAFLPTMLCCDTRLRDGPEPPDTQRVQSPKPKAGPTRC